MEVGRMVNHDGCPESTSSMRPAEDLAAFVDGFWSGSAVSWKVDVARIDLLAFVLDAFA